MAHHGAALRKLSSQPNLILELAALDLAGLSSTADRVLLEFALKLTRTPGEVTSEDSERLRGAGFDDRAIHDACQVVAYFNYVNRIADGLGVELEERFQAGPERP